MPTVNELVDGDLVRGAVPIDSGDSELFTPTNPGEVAFSHSVPVTGEVDANIARQTRYVEVTIAEGGWVTESIDCRGYTMFTIQMPADWDLASVGFLTARQQGGTHRPYHNADGELLELTEPTAGYNYELPTNLAGVLWMQIWSERDRENLVQTDNRVFTITMKA